MIDSKKAIGVALALTAAGMISISAPIFAGSSDAQVHCFGVNKCKGHNDCKTATNACKGHASCKGQGFVTVSASACDHLGGTAK
jgi:hypothetical protein